MSATRSVPAPIIAAARLYRFHQRWWLYLHYFVGMVGVVAGAAASLVKGNIAFGFLAAAAASVVTFLGPQQKGERYKQAQLRLEGAMLRFQELPSTTMEWLLDEFDQVQSHVLGANTKSQATPVTQAKSG